MKRIAKYDEHLSISTENTSACKKQMALEGVSTINLVNFTPRWLVQESVFNSSKDASASIGLTPSNIPLEVRLNSGVLAKA